MILLLPPLLSSPRQQAEGEQALRGDWDFGEPEEVQARGVDEKVWSADVYSVQDGAGMGQRLVDSEGEVLQGVEMLLSALEACGVDNARCGAGARTGVGQSVGQWRSVGRSVGQRQTVFWRW